MSLRDDLALVRNHFPKARAQTVGMIVHIALDSYRHIGEGKTERAAWADAAKRVIKSQTGFG